MWKSKLLRSAIINMFVRFAQVIFAVLIIGPFIAGNYNIKYLVEGMMLIALCVFGVVMFSFDIKED